MPIVAVAGSFDDLRSRHIRFLQEASRFGEVHVQLWSDRDIVARAGRAPKFPEAERLYFVDALRYVKHVAVMDPAPPGGADALPPDLHPDIWVVEQAADNAARRAFAAAQGIRYEVITDDQLVGFPLPAMGDAPPSPHRVIVTGCFDWVHTGHVRFFEEASEYGDLYVAAGSDANLRLLKGEGHPLFPQDERRYIVQSIRFVSRALIASGSGWLDAEPEIQLYRPDRYIVNEDGDRPEKRDYCARHGIEYIVLKRLPKPGLTRRQSTALRGF